MAFNILKVAIIASSSRTVSVFCLGIEFIINEVEIRDNSSFFKILCIPFLGPPKIIKIF